VEAVTDGVVEFMTANIYEALNLVESLFDRGDSLTVYADIIHRRGEVLNCVVIFGFSKRISRAVRTYIPVVTYPEGYSPPMEPAHGEARKVAELLKRLGYNASTPYEQAELRLVSYEREQ